MAADAAMPETRHRNGRRVAVSVLTVSLAALAFAAFAAQDRLPGGSTGSTGPSTTRVRSDSRRSTRWGSNAGCGDCVGCSTKSLKRSGKAIREGSELPAAKLLFERNGLTDRRAGQSAAENARGVSTFHASGALQKRKEIGSERDFHLGLDLAMRTSSRSFDPYALMLIKTRNETVPLLLGYLMLRTSSQRALIR